MPNASSVLEEATVVAHGPLFAELGALRPAYIMKATLFVPSTHNCRPKCTGAEKDGLIDQKALGNVADR